MNTGEQFLRATTRDRLDMARIEANGPELTQLLGAQAFTELRAQLDADAQALRTVGAKA